MIRKDIQSLIENKSEDGHTSFNNLQTTLAVTWWEKVTQENAVTVQMQTSLGNSILTPEICSFNSVHIGQVGDGGREII